MEQRVFIGIGSNVGGTVQNCLSAIARLSEDARVGTLLKSSLYVTSPVSDIKQSDFINCAVSLVWDGSPFELLALLNTIEERMGRKRSVKDGPRVIDLDILLFGDLILDTPSLKIPHPELHKRRFAIVPCVEIDSVVAHPVYKKQLKEFLSEIGDDQRIRCFR